MYNILAVLSGIAVISVASQSYGGSGGKLAFSALSLNGDYEIYVVTSDGTGIVNLTNHPGNDLTPVWSPDGSRVAFSSDRDGDVGLFLMGDDGSNPTWVASSGFLTYPTWSPDGKKIAFTSSLEDYSEIYVIDADGTDLTRLTYQLEGTPVDNAMPAWSPDGTKIAFSTFSGGECNDDIWVMNSDGSNRVNLTGRFVGEQECFAIDYDAPEDYEPAWSPDGTKIAFGSDRNGEQEIYVMNADGTNPVQLSQADDGDGEHISPTWSPDGTEIAFLSGDFDDEEGAYEIFIIRSDGSSFAELVDQPAAGGWGTISWSHFGTATVIGKVSWGQIKGIKH